MDETMIPTAGKFRVFVQDGGRHAVTGDGLTGLEIVADSGDSIRADMTADQLDILIQALIARRDKFGY